MPLPSSKFRVPAISPGIVARPRLVEALRRGLEPERGVALVSAPAGFGKTTLLVEWASGMRAEAGSKRLAWLSLDEEDDDSARFLRCVILALRAIEPRIGEAAMSLSGSPLASTAKTLMALLVEDIRQVDEPLVLVIDDFHCIRDPTLLEALAFLLDNRPPTMGIVIASRSDPGIPLSRLRVRGRLVELRSEDLRFTRGEASAFFGRVLGFPLADDAIDRLEEKTEGWAAALKLASLSLSGRKDAAPFIRDFGGSDRRVFDYLAEEVVDGLPEETRDFLIRASVPDRFCASLCEALRGFEANSSSTGEKRSEPGDRATARAAAQVLLERLERSNLFLVPLDERREWYRFHRLFADFLRARLDPEHAAIIHRGAALWFEGRGMVTEAVRHILAYAKAAGDYEDAERIIIDAGGRALAEGELVRLLSWLDELPEGIVADDPWLSSFKAWSLVMTGRSDEAERYIGCAEKGLAPDAAPVDRGRVLSLRCSVSSADFVVEAGPRALELLGDSDLLSRTGMLFTLGDAQDDLGDVIGAERSFGEAYELSSRRGFLAMGAVALAHKALSIHYQGRRDEALNLCLRGIEKYTDSRGAPLPVAGLLFVVSGELRYDVDALEESLKDLEKGVDLGRRAAAIRVLLYGMEEIARVLFASGDVSLALETIGEAKALAVESGEAEWRSAAEAMEAFFSLRRGDLAAARLWADRSGLSPDGKPDQTLKNEYSTYVRILLASGETEGARRVLGKLESDALRQRRTRHLLTILVQLSLADWLSGDKEKAMAGMARALGLAERGKCFRAFLDEGPLVQEILRGSRRGWTPFAARLDRSFSFREGLRNGTATAETPLGEPLSGRELEVLRLMAMRLSTPRIGERLYVSPSTVRSHVKHIYGKLGAHSRHEAVELAKKARLI